LDDKGVRVSTFNHEAVTCGDVANPLEITAAERDVETKQIYRSIGLNRENVQSVRIRRVVVDENRLALRYSHREPDIVGFGELDPLRRR
jgi:hypothetical protein